MKIDGFTVIYGHDTDNTLYVFNDYTGYGEVPEEERKYKPIEPRTVNVANIKNVKTVALCKNPERMKGTERMGFDLCSKN